MIFQSRIMDLVQTEKMFVMKATIFGVMNNAQNLIDELN